MKDLPDTGSLLKLLRTLRSTRSQETIERIREGYFPLDLVHLLSLTELQRIRDLLRMEPEQLFQLELVIFHRAKIGSSRLMIPEDRCEGDRTE